jgi:hypothetical protein
MKDDEGRPSFSVTARNREKLGTPDPVLSNLTRSHFDEVWLFAVDTGDGLTVEDCQGINEFRKLGRGLMVTRDHMDLGSSSTKRYVRNLAFWLANREVEAAV